MLLSPSYYTVFIMPASIRVIKIIKNSVGSEAYTLEFECTADEAKDLLKELTSTPYGQRLIQLLNTSQFLPEIPNKTEDELRAEAEDEEIRIERNAEKLKEIGRRDATSKFFTELRKHYGDDFVKEFEIALEEDKKKEEEEPSEERHL